MFLIDTNVISEYRKQSRANHGVIQFFKEAAEQRAKIYLSVITIGELRRGVESARYRGDIAQAIQLDTWVNHVLKMYGDKILPLNEEVAQLWGRLRVPHYENALDKQIAATALVHNLTLVTRNLTSSPASSCGRRCAERAGIPTELHR